MITRWEPEKLKAKISEQLISNGEIVGKFAETDARRRLLEIKDPEWGKKYRQLIVARLLTFVVVRERNGIAIFVGVAKGKSGTHHGYYIELGSKTAPAHPFLRPAVFENAQKIVALLAGE